MNDRELKLNPKNCVLFVWDGTERFIQDADQILEQVENHRVHAVYALPHESIHAYGTVGQTHCGRNSLEQSIHFSYTLATQNTKHLNGSCLELLYGERINEILRIAELIRCEAILMPRFEQSAFSKWIHGDLNKHVLSLAKCPVEFLNEQSRNETSAAGNIRI